MQIFYHQIFSATIGIFCLVCCRSANASADITPYLGSNSAYTIQPLTEQEYNNFGGSNKFEYYDGANLFYYSWQIKSGEVSNPPITTGNGGADVNVKFLGLDKTSGLPYGGAVYPQNGIIGNITGDFVNSGITMMNTTNYVAGGVIYNNGTIGNINGDFVGNYIRTNVVAYGGAIDNYFGKMGNVSGNFIGNYAFSSTDTAYGGALMNESSTIGGISANFVGNYAMTQGANKFAYGGAVYSDTDITFVANGVDNVFSGNYTQDSRGKIYNAIYIKNGKTLTFAPSNSGSITLFDTIDGQTPYNIVINSDGSGKFNMNNQIINAANVVVNNAYVHFGQGLYGQGNFAGSQTNLILNNATFDLANGYMDTINVKNYNGGNSLLFLDVSPTTLTSDLLNINGNVLGTTRVVVHADTTKDIRNLGSVVFAHAVGDTTGTESSFEIFRVYRSPYLFDIDYTDHDPNDKTWALIMNNNANANPNNPADGDGSYRTKVVSEVIAYNGLPTAAFEQTRSLKNSLSRNLDRIGAEENYAWVTPIYQSATIKMPFYTDANINGLEAGFDVQRDEYNRLGVFGSYRQGEYKMNGQGPKIYSPVGSKIDIDSYMGGIYHTYQRNHFRTLAAVGGGIQEAKICTNDGIGAKTQGKEFMAYAEMGRLFEIDPLLDIEPIISVSHTLLDFDTIHDVYGKTADYGTQALSELEFGIKFGQQRILGKSEYEIYLKPAVVRVLSSGDAMRISGMDKESAYDDNTLGRLEIGANIEYDNHLSAYGFAGYSKGSAYESANIGLGLRYSW